MNNKIATRRNDLATTSTQALAAHPVAKKLAKCAAARKACKFDLARKYLSEAEMVLALRPVDGGLKACHTAKKILSMEQRAYDVQCQIRADRVKQLSK